MIFTVGELLTIQEGLGKLKDVKNIPAKTGYQIAKLLRGLSGPVTDATQARNNLIRKYSGPATNGSMKVLPENMLLYIQELNELASETVDVDVKEVVLPPDAILPDATTLVGLDRFISVNIGD